MYSSVTWEDFQLGRHKRRKLGIQTGLHPPKLLCLFKRDKTRKALWDLVVAKKKGF